MTGTKDVRPVALIADDDELTRLMLSETLDQAGFMVIAVSDGKAALEVGRETEFAIAMLDVEMPGLDGYRVCAAFRAHTAKRHVPIVMITGRDDATSVNRAYDAGATDFIAKPLNWPLIPHRLRYVMRNAHATRELELREAENRALIESIPDRIHLVTHDGRIRRALTGHLDNDMPETDGTGQFATLLPTGVRQQALRDIALTASDGLPRTHEVDAADADGTPRYYEMRYFKCGTGDVMALRQDVTPRRVQEKHIRELAYIDLLTGLPNRAAFVDLVAAAIANQHSDPAHVAVLYMEFDGFRRINETFGHSIGGALVREISVQLEQYLNSARVTGFQWSLARIGEAEFAICMRDRHAEETALAIADAFLQRFREPLRFNEREFFLSPRTGIAMYPAHGRDVETLLKNAETALGQARNASARAVYSEVMSARSLEWLSLDAHLRRAIRDEQLLLHFQPKIRLRDGALTGVEALLRWHHPDLGDVSPARFIPLAEETGLILDIGAWVVRAACRQLRNWDEQGLATTIAINVSGTEFVHGSPAAIVRRETSAAGVDPSRLQIEITESVLVKDSAEVQAGLIELRRLGCRIALDDFGTGYSSLAYLKRFPPDTIKIDRAFVSNVHRDASDAAIVEAIIALARSLNLIVIAEGIEEEAQLAWLRARGCHEAQGFLLCRPVSAMKVHAKYASTATDARATREAG